MPFFDPDTNMLFLAGKVLTFFCLVINLDNRILDHIEAFKQVMFMVWQLCHVRKYPARKYTEEGRGGKQKVL